MPLRFRFTKAELTAITPPEGKAFIEVQDDMVRALRCRISQLGRLTMFVDKKVGKHHIKKKIGIYEPGPGGKTIDDFRKMARAELGQIEDDPQGWLEGASAADAGEITIEKAFEITLNASRRGDMAKRDWNYAVDAFTKWLKANHPYVQAWARLRRQHVREYLESLQPTEKARETRGIDTLSPTRLRLSMQPIAQTARHMWLEHELPNVAERLGLSAKLAKTPAPVYLQDVLLFLDHLKGRDLFALEAGAALAGLGGLQLLEVLRLRWSQVDRDKGLVEISGEVKNTYRNRVIPLPLRCLEALQRAYDNRLVGQVVELDGGPVVVSPAGRPFEGKSWMNYSKLIRAEFLAWNKAIKWTPKDLRNCVMTLAALKGFSGDIVEQYVGHAPRTVTARNYIPRLTAASIGEAAQLEAQMKIFRDLVVDHINREVGEAYEKIKASKTKRKGEAKTG